MNEENKIIARKLAEIRENNRISTQESEISHLENITCGDTIIHHDVHYYLVLDIGGETMFMNQHGSLNRRSDINYSRINEIRRITNICSFAHNVNFLDHKHSRDSSSKIIWKKEELK